MSSTKTDLRSDKYVRDGYGNCFNYTREEIGPHKVLCHIPGGISYEAIDKGGSQIFPWMLLELFDCVYADGKFAEIDSKLLAKENMEFYATLKMEIARDFHEYTAPKFPLQVMFELAYIGNSSIGTTRTLSHPDQEKNYGTLSVQSVLVNNDSRKPIKLPDWWKNKYGPYCKNGTSIRMEPLVRPAHARITSYPVNVYNSHCDMYKHTHYSSYALFCYNAYVDGVNKQKYNHVTKRSLENGIKTLDISYLQEPLLGDKLTVESWEDENSPNILNFEIKKENVTCCEVIISFYD